MRMYKRKPAFFLLIILFFSAAIPTGCVRSDAVEAIREERLFHLEYGNFDGQLGVSDLNSIGKVRIGLAMRDGFFYIVDGEAGKVMELNSYGDLLSLFYNDDSLSDRLISASSRPASEVRQEISYPFIYPGMIAADSRKCIYAVCSIPRDRQERSDDSRVLYGQTVLRFSRDGSSADYIGQQGPGGTPFPFVRNIYITAADELVVVCMTMDGFTVFWFAPDGFLKYMIPVDSETVPDIGDGSSFVAVENVIPDPSSYTVYVKADYYSSYIDEESRVQSGINYIQTMLYPLSVETGIYDAPVSVPPYEESVVADYSRLIYRMPYDFLGVTENGWKFFIIKTDDGFNIEMIQNENQRILRRQFKVNHRNVVYSSISLSQGGIITALYLDQNEADVVWYRTDRLIDAILKS